MTDDYAMSALTVAISSKPDQICSTRDFLRMTQLGPSCRTVPRVEDWQQAAAGPIFMSRPLLRGSPVQCCAFVC
jgi:hypothetical protein